MRSRNRSRACAVIAMGAMVGAVSACSGTTSPSAPSSSGALAASYVGTWTGTMSNQAAPTANLTVVIASAIGVEPSLVVSGTYSRVSPEARFSAQGTVSGTVDGARVLLTFPPSTLPCPGFPGDAAERNLGVNLTLSATRLSGDYGVTGCPGGTIDLTKRP